MQKKLKYYRLFTKPGIRERVTEDGERRERGEYLLGFWEISSRIPRNFTFWGMSKKILSHNKKDSVDVKE